MKDAFEPIVTIAVAIVGVAILAVLVSQKSNTAGVLAAAGSAFANSLSAATGPVTGSVSAPVNNIGGSSFGLGGGSGLSIPSL